MKGDLTEKGVSRDLLAAVIGRLIKRGETLAAELACWDYLGKPLGEVRVVRAGGGYELQ